MYSFAICKNKMPTNTQICMQKCFKLALLVILKPHKQKAYHSKAFTSYVFATENLNSFVLFFMLWNKLIVRKFYFLNFMIQSIIQSCFSANFLIVCLFCGLASQSTIFGQSGMGLSLDNQCGLPCLTFTTHIT